MGMGAGEHQSKEIPLSTLAQNPHKGVVREISLRDQKKTRKGKVPEQSTEEKS